MPTRADFVAAARAWDKTKWRHQGRDANGLDCAGLIIKSAHGVQISSFDITGYPKRPKDAGDFLAHFIGAGCVSKPHSTLLAGDVVILKLEKYPFHCGIYTGGPGEGRIIHAYAASPWRCVVEMPFTGILRAGWTSCLGVPGLSD